MSVPALPEIFGNYVLGPEFVEVTSPQAISWWPQTTGWTLLAFILLGLAADRARKRLLHWYRNRYRREATQQLHHLGRAGASDINRLLKLTALAAFPRERVASLSGESWVTFLNAQCDEPVFDAELGRLLALGAYTGQPLEKRAREQLMSASLTWIQQHRNPRDV